MSSHTMATDPMLSSKGARWSIEGAGEGGAGGGAGAGARAGAGGGRRQAGLFVFLLAGATTRPLAGGRLGAADFKAGFNFFAGALLGFCLFAGGWSSEKKHLQ